MKLPIYLDYAATTPVDIKVAEKMMNYLTINGIFGNPASHSHRYGWEAEEAVDIARNYIANLIGAIPEEIIFTSGSTESNNLALKGIAYANKNKGRHIITARSEHTTIIDICKKLEIEGFQVTWLTPYKNGIISPKQLYYAIRDDTILVSLMHVNNETGIINDVESFGQLCQSQGIIFHVDGTQSVGKLPLNLSLSSIDLMSFSSHKIYGPKGIGVLFIKRKSQIKLETQIHGGGQEYGIRSGTLPVHQIVGMGEACKIASKILNSEMNRLKILRNRLWNGLHQIEEIIINSDLQNSIDTILNISVQNIKHQDLIMVLRDLAVSMGSACTSHSKLSHVLQAMGLNDLLIKNSIRFSLGRFTSVQEIDYTVNYMNMIISKLRK